MIEQQLAERFHAAVGDEPPLELDPDEFVDRLLRRRRHRQAMATVFAVVAIATVAVAGVTSTGRDSGERAAAPPSTPLPALPTPPPTTLSTTDLARDEVKVDVAAPVLPKGKFSVEPVETLQDGARAGVSAVIGFVVDQSAVNDGLLQIRQGDEVLYEADLGNSRSMSYDFARPVFVKAGQTLSIAVNCRKTMSADGMCHATVTFSVPKVAR